ncbi:MAG: D-tyrosyl-tRNA(Tyr) deacylase [Firmicutes bacterium HGW-Firmicutes-12]|jgi:D-tyrosyl-tRNA(Tyr) deacylase|nr:MAG: D-tyrosyl-tRNA(Tyr) deacylase [Firmicutes bacterium HGW-Firmicutes-12]
MRTVVQRVTTGSVFIDDREISRIGLGLLILLGIRKDDQEEDVRYLADKVVNLRVFEDNNGKMNLSVKDIGGELLVVSQFTLYGDTRQGRRPGFSEAASGQEAEPIYQLFVNKLRQYGIEVKTGVFQEHMLVKLDNNGPVTLLLDSRKIF